MSINYITCEQCGDKHQAQLPERLTSGQMRPNVLAFVAVQAGQFYQSITKIQQQLEQNFGLRFSRGAISETQRRVSAMLTPAYHAIKQEILTAPIVHADETSYKRGNENRWLWQICTDKLSGFMAHHSRVTIHQVLLT